MRISDWSSEVCSSDLLNVLLAEGLNLGLRKMAEASNTHDYWQLSRLARWHVESEAIDQALANVVAAQGALPMAQVWGMGRSASADGQFLPAARQDEAMNTMNARYGKHQIGRAGGREQGGKKR